MGWAVMKRIETALRNVIRDAMKRCRGFHGVELGEFRAVAFDVAFLFPATIDVSAPAGEAKFSTRLLDTCRMALAHKNYRPVSRSELRSDMAIYWYELSSSRLLRLSRRARIEVVYDGHMWRVQILKHATQPIYMLVPEFIR
jgi:hypothetical protein